MAQTVFKTITTQDEHSNRVQANVTDAFNRINASVSSNVSALQTLINALQTQLNNITMATTLKVSAPISVGQSGTYIVPANAYAIIQNTGNDAADTIDGLTLATSGVAKGNPFYLGPGQGVLGGPTYAGIHFFGVEFINN